MKPPQYFFVQSKLRRRTASKLPAPMSATVNNSPETTAESWLEIVQQKVGSMRFGTVQIIVHDGHVTQIESTEKTRLPSDVKPLGGKK